MPCLTDEVDCLLCGNQAKCQQIESKRLTGEKEWSKYFCELLHIEPTQDDPLEASIHKGFYCVECVCKIQSIDKISRLVEQMRTTLVNIRDKVEDVIYLSNPHLYGEVEDAPANGEKDQSNIRGKLLTLVETVKKKRSEAKTAEVGTETEPVTILETEVGLGVGSGDPRSPESYFVLLNDTENKADKECQCTLLSDETTTSGAVPVLEAGDETASEGGKRRQLIKIRISSDSVSQEIIDSLTKQQGTSQTRQLIIRGYREVESPLPMQEVEPKANLVKRKRGPKPRDRNSPWQGVPCRICGKYFPNRTIKKEHVQEIHKQGDQWKCTECDYTVTTDQSLIRHVKTHIKTESIHTAAQENSHNGNDIVEEYCVEEEVEEHGVEDEIGENGDEELENGIADESDPEYGCSSEEEDEDIRVSRTRSRRKRKQQLTPRKVAQQSGNKKVKNEIEVPVIKVASNKRISGQVRIQEPEPVPANLTPRKSGRVRTSNKFYV